MPGRILDCWQNEKYSSILCLISPSVSGFPLSCNSTLLTIYCRKIEQERRIPFDITADPDPFYSESNISYLKKKLDALEAGDLPLEEHELIEVD